MDLAKYQSLFSRNKEQSPAEVFAFFPPEIDRLTNTQNFNSPWIKLAEVTLEGAEAWEFASAKYKKKYHQPYYKLRNYLQYTFTRLKDVEATDLGKYVAESVDKRRCCFNSGLQDRHSSDLFSSLNDTLRDVQRELETRDQIGSIRVA